ncbi:MAG: hypothetical protein QXQ14_03120 [Candidatus Aenigmatarchaeota archaeon]
MQSYKYYKLQFVVLTVSIIAIFFFSYFLFLQQTYFIDLSSMLVPEVMIVKNIKEKAVEISKIAKNCEELKYYAEEFANDIKIYLKNKGIYANLRVLATPCELPNYPNVPGSVEMLLEVGSENFYYKEIITFGWP